MNSSKLYTPREAAQVLGISYPTLKQWIYKKQIRTVQTAGGHHRVPEKEVDKFLYRRGERAPVPERRSNFRRISGRSAGRLWQSPSAALEPIEGASKTDTHTMSDN